MKFLLCVLLLPLANFSSRAAEIRVARAEPVVSAAPGATLANATARLLAGMPLEGTPLSAYGSDPAWLAHAGEMEKAWQRLERVQLAQIRAWGPQFLGASYADEGPMFYLFSGPDFLYANAFFPRASTYILCGIEPVGTIPDLLAVPKGALPPALANLRKSLDSVLSWSFFITKNMKVDLTQKQLNGTLPVLYVFLARMGYTIESVELVGLDQSGGLAAPERGTTPGVKLVLRGAPGREQTLYYFCSNLENEGIKTSPGFIKFCEQQGPGVSLAKAASYLMHTGGFTRSRDFLLAHSKAILEDDSGIPYKYLADGKWRVRFGGHYAGPIALFKQFPQPNLAADFAASSPAPLGFGFGYQWHSTRSAVIFAERRDEGAKPSP